MVTNGVFPAGGGRGVQSRYVRAARTDSFGLHEPAVTATATPVGSAEAYGFSDSRLRYRITFNLSNATTRFRAQPRARSTVTNTTGLVPRGEQYVWTGTTTTPALTVVVDASDGGYRWLFARTPFVAYRWTANGTTHCTTTADDASLTVTAPGTHSVTTSPGHAFVSTGTHEVVAFTVEGTRYRIVYDREYAASDFDATALRRTIARTARHFDVNATTTAVTLFALPSTASTAAYAYRTPRVPHQRDVVVNSMEPVGVAGGIWTHELVHTHQTFDLGPRMRWFREGSAQYYATLIPSQYDRPRAADGGGDGTAEAATASISDAVEARDTAVLSKPATWSNQTQYHRGALALLVLGNRLRTASNGTYTVTDLFGWMNRHRGTVTYEAFRREVVRHSTPRVGIWLDRHVTSTHRYNVTDVDIPPGPVGNPSK